MLYLTRNWRVTAAGSSTGAAAGQLSAAFFFRTLKKDTAAASVAGKKACWPLKTVETGSCSRVTIGYTGTAHLAGTFK